jgi:hypothetical protein
VARLKRRDVAVCYCPETHAYFGHSPWPMDLMIDELPVLIGTDSLASAWSLAPLEQLRRALRSHPALPAAEALLSVTMRARDAVLGYNPNLLHADFTILRTPYDRYAAVHEARNPDETEKALRDLLLDEATVVADSVVGGFPYSEEVQG